MDCLFCKIIAGEIPSTKVYEDENVYAFKDINPVTPIHVLVIPKKHFANFLEVDQDTLSHLMKVVQNLSKQIIEKCDAKGLNILTNTNEVAGQTVHHFHIHILPRYNNEELDIHFTDHSETTDLEEVFTTIKK